MNEPQLAMAWRVVGDLFEATQPSQSTDSSAALADSEQDDPELKNNLPKSAMFQSEVRQLRHRFRPVLTQKSGLFSAICHLTRAV